MMLDKKTGQRISTMIIDPTRETIATANSSARRRKHDE